MANKNKNTKELVDTNTDSTSELAELTLQQVLASKARKVPLEQDEDTFEIERPGNKARNADVKVLHSELESRSETVERLRCDVEKLRARLHGLQTEVKAREDISKDLNREVADLNAQLDTMTRLLRARDRTIDELREDVNDRAGAMQTLIRERDALMRDREADAATASLPRPLGRDGSDSSAAGERDGLVNALRARVAELCDRQERIEAYADSLRRQLNDRIETAEDYERKYRHTRTELAENETIRETLEQQIRLRADDNRALAEQIAIMQARHNEEIRNLRFELGEAQDTVTQNMLVSEQLEADLVESRQYRDEMARMIKKTSGEYQETIADLEDSLETLQALNAETEHKLAVKTDALDSLLADIATRPREEVAEVSLPEIDDLPTAEPLKSRDRVNRMLIGKIDKQELRFPLFKKHLTIGRNHQNDIQLDAPYISRRHAVILTEGDATRVVDWGSRNGVFINGKRVTEHFLRSGDLLTIGNAEFRYEERPRRDA